QDDIIGGSSELFSLVTLPNVVTQPLRPDAPNTIFGGSGTHVARNDCGAAVTNAPVNNLSAGCGATDASGHAHDSDTVVANNGDIVRLVGTAGGTHATLFLAFAYDNYAGTEKIVPRAVTLLDYTAGGPDLKG